MGSSKRKAMLGVEACRRLTGFSNSQQLATTCNRMCKRAQHVTSNNVGSVANNVASVCTGVKNGVFKTVSSYM